jgi:hypothetical protein
MGLEDEQLALGGTAGSRLALAAEGDPVPRLRERDQARPAAVAMRRQHRADALIGGVGADDDVVGRNALEHGDPRVARQAVDGPPEVCNGRSAPGSHRVCPLDGRAALPL